jgi:hypothetical protein
VTFASWYDGAWEAATIADYMVLLVTPPGFEPGGPACVGEGTREALVVKELKPKPVVHFVVLRSRTPSTSDKCEPSPNHADSQILGPLLTSSVM